MGLLPEVVQAAQGYTRPGLQVVRCAVARRPSVVATLCQVALYTVTRICIVHCWPVLGANFAGGSATGPGTVGHAALQLKGFT